ncbi:sulfatase-like hydrolase/transferase [Haliscomenobacter sp.]|uniref:sulfatase-like hydrolase/transferase n=1 Tax=Haliscomenobacter sp. TaxID=2717303 RepID=UPI003BAC3A1C
MLKKILPIFGFLFLTYTTHAQRNVILIIADDVGSDYCGFYENHLDTCKLPNVRRLLARGVRFRNAWSNPLCSPTRAGILTGRYSFRTGVGDAIGGAGSAVLDTAEITIPKLLNRYAPNGIAKANIGKWHLQSPMPNTNLVYPNRMGYDHFEGNFTGMLNSFTNWTKVKNGVSSNVTTYATTETANNAISWIKTQGNKPFFLWLAFNAPHTPHHLPPTSLHSYKNLSGTTADIAANPKSYFKASVEALDHEIGRLFDSLQALGKWDNTDIIFIGDNGNESSVAQSRGGAKGSIDQEGVGVPFIISGPSVVNPNRVSDALLSTHDLFATILELFGYSDWPGQIPANKPVDSRSIMPILKNQLTEVRSWVFTEVFKNPSVAGDGKTMRNKDYKLLDFDNGAQKFFRISNDPTESNDLLLSTMDATAKNNYTALCTEMTKLVGTGGFCNLSTPTTDLTNAHKQLRIYPNPVLDFLTLEHAQGNEAYRVLNGLGQVLYAGVGIQKLNLSGLDAGVYFLELVGKERTVLRFLKGRLHN